MLVSSHLNPKKIVFHIIFFTLGLIVADQVLLYVGDHLSHSDYHDDRLYSRLANAKNLDAVILGGCRAALHFDSNQLNEILHLHFFNAGKVVDGLGHMDFTLQLALARARPKVAVVVIDDGNWEQTLEELRTEVERRLPLFDFLNEQQQQELKKNYQVNTLLMHSGFWRYKGQGEALLKTLYRKLRHKRRPNPDGYDPRNPEQNILEALKKQDRLLANQRKTFVPTDFALKSIHRFISELKKADVLPVLVVVPMHRLRATPEVNEQQGEALRKLAAEEDVPYLNYLDNTEFANRDIWWSDAGHMNQLGAENFTAMFSKDLKMILDHRGVAPKFSIDKGVNSK